MPNWTQKVQPNSSMRGLPAKAYNKFIDAAKFVENQQNLAPTGNQPSNLPGSFAQFVNTLGVKLNRGDAVGLDGIAITPLHDPAEATDNQGEYENGILFDIADADPELHIDSWGIVFDDTTEETDETWRITISGPAITKVLVTDENHMYCMLTKDETYLTSSPAGGFPILWKDEGVDEEVDAVVFVGPPSYAPVYEATAGESGGEITAQRLDSTGTLTGEEQTFLILPA